MPVINNQSYLKVEWLALEDSEIIFSLILNLNLHYWDV